MSLIESRGAEAVRPGSHASVDVGGLRHEVPFTGSATGEAQLAVRPNAMFLKEPGTAGFNGRVLSAAYLGDHVEYEIDTAIGIRTVAGPSNAVQWVLSGGPYTV